MLFHSYDFFFRVACRRAIRAEVVQFSCEVNGSMWGLRSSRWWQWRFMPSGMRNHAVWRKFTDFCRSLWHPSSGSRCPRSVVSYKFTNTSDEYGTVVFRVPALYFRGCVVANPGVDLPTFRGTFLPPSSGYWVTNFGHVMPYSMADNIGVSEEPVASIFRVNYYFPGLTSCISVQVNAPILVYFCTKRRILSDVKSLLFPESPLSRLC